MGNKFLRLKKAWVLIYWPRKILIRLDKCTALLNLGCTQKDPIRLDKCTFPHRLFGVLAAHKSNSFGFVMHPYHAAPNFYCCKYMSHVMRKPDFCICKNKGAGQLRGNREADQRLCFCYMDRTIPLLRKSEISSL